MLIAFAASSSCRFFRRDQAPTPQPVPITPAPARQPESQPASVPPKPAVSRPLTAAEKGIGPDGIPLYLARGYTPNERALLLGAFGIEAPQRMYLSDSSDAAILKYDVRLKQCRACYVDTYRVGFLSMRHPDETWERFEARIRQPASKPAAAPPPRKLYTSLDDLDPGARVAFGALIDSARRAGFKLTVGETYRTPEREARLLTEGRGRTYTATSMHSYGRAVDIRVDDGNLERALTRANWIRFRKFVTKQADGAFRLVGTADRTWDWPHIELPGAQIGFHSVDDALEFARRCLTDSARARAPSAEKLGGAVSDPCVVVPNLTFGAGVRRISDK